MREIGSNFWLSPEDANAENKDISLKTLGIEGNDEAFFSTGRAAQSFVLDEIEKDNPDIGRIALIPPYTCHTVIEPFLKHGYEIHAYPVDKHLKTTAEMLENVIKCYSPSVVLIHRYFGFNTVNGCEDVIKKYSAKGIIFIEDRTQSLFSEFPSLPVQYITGSLRKWAGLPDGGFAISLCGKLDGKPLLHDERLMQAKVEASLEKYDFIVNGIGNKDSFLEKYRKAEEILGAEDRYYSISPISAKVFSIIDIQQLRSIRRQNYNVLYEGIKGSNNIDSVLPETSEIITPFYFMLWTDNRVDLQRMLRENRIYAPIVWLKEQISPTICEAAEELYQHALCIPVDQRYQSEDMLRIVDCLMK